MGSAELLPIGELARRTGVAVSALRYYEELGLLVPARRISNRRHYRSSAVDVVAVIRFLADVGFTLREISELMGPGRTSAQPWRELARRKLDELDERHAKIEAAKSLLSHALGCQHEDIARCPRFREAVTGHFRGESLEAAHRH